MTLGTDITDARKLYRKRNEGDFPERLTLSFTKEWDLKYGENPAQHAAIYILDNARRIAELTNLQSVRSDGRGKGGLSLTNTLDISRAMDVLKYFPDLTSLIMKHNIVSGFTKQTNPTQTMTDLFRSTRDGDRRSNMGGTAVFNQPLDLETAEAMYELRGDSPFFVDVVAAPDYEPEVVGYIESQAKEIRIASFSGLDELPKFQGDGPQGLLSIKEIPGGRVGIQDIYLTSIKTPEDLIMHPMKKGVYVERAPTPTELDDLVTSWYLNIAGARSNGVVAVRSGRLVSMGSGQVERIGAVEQMIIKGMQKAMDREGIEYDPLLGIMGYGQLQDNPFEGASVSSDGFYPFGDSLETLARVGVTATLQPYGSKRDKSVIEAANKHNMAAPATLERCFGHF